MVQLRIDGQEAAIKKGTNFQLTFENSYFAKGNTWSFDIELPLDDQRNAAIFGVINRHDVRQKPQTHTAELIVPGMNHIVGSVVVTKVTETSVSIQLATTRDAIDTKVANRYITTFAELGLVYHQKRWTNFPVMNTDGEVLGDCAVHATSVYDETSWGDYGIKGRFKFVFEKMESSTQWPYQPYFLDVVEGLIKAAGYTINTNVLDTPMMNALIIVRATTQKRICNHLPHWTFSEFVTEVERFAGVHFIFNNTTKVVNIVPLNSLLTDLEYNTDVVVVDEFSAESNNDTEIDDTLQANNNDGNKNVGYDLLGDYSDSYEKLSETILDAANITPVSSYAEMEKMHKDGTDNQKQLFILDGDYYLPHPDGSPFLCNRLHDIKTSDEADVELLRITPVAFTDHTFSVYDNTHDGQAVVKGETSNVRLMVSEGRNPSSVIDAYLVDTITGDEDEDDDSYADVMRVAFVDDLEMPVGMKMWSSYPEKMYWAWGLDKDHQGWEYKENLLVKFPYTMPGFLQYDKDNHIDAVAYYDFDRSRGEESKYQPNIDAINNRPYTLELTARSAAGNGKAQSIKRLLPDTTIEYTKRIIAHALPDVDKLFLIHGKRFICKSLTVEINEEGIVPLMEGTFYMFD